MCACVAERDVIGSKHGVASHVHVLQAQPAGCACRIASGYL
jgi:hypothetical protein